MMSKKALSVWGLIFLSAAAVALAEVHPSQPAFTTIKVPNESDTSIFGISNTGVMVGTYLDKNGIYHGFVRSASGRVTTVDDPSGANTILEGISPKGQYIVGVYFSSDLKTRRGLMYQNAKFANISPPGSSTSGAFGVNDSGEVVGEYEDSQNHGHGYYWNGTSFTTLDVPNGVNSSALGINNSGMITLYWQDSSSNIEGALYTGGAYKTINVPGAVDSVPWGIDSKGDIVFSWDWDLIHKPSHGALFTASGTFELMDDPYGAGFTIARGINDLKTIVGSYYSGSYKVLHSFCATNCTDGAYPLAGLIRDKSGNLYGTTANGGTGNQGYDGTVFKVDSTGHETVLYNFDSCSSNCTTDGFKPLGGLIRDTKGDLYGTTWAGGAGGPPARFSSWTVQGTRRCSIASPPTLWMGFSPALD